MRKIIVISSLFLFLSILAGNTPHAETVNMIIYNFDGQTSVIRNRKTLELNPDMTAQNDDFFRTGDESFIDLAMYDVCGIRFLAKSEGTLVKSSPGEGIIRLEKGALLLNFKKLSNAADFEIETPTAVAVVTEAVQFSCVIGRQTDQKLLTTFTVKKGFIRVRTKGLSATVTVLEGQALEISENSYIPSVRNGTDEEIKIADMAKTVYVAERPKT